MNAQVTPLFSAPIYTVNIDISTCPDLEQIEYTYRKTQDPAGDNYISSNDRILDDAEWKPIRDQADHHVERYFREIMSAKQSVGIQITNSWVNRYVKDQSHMRHMHPNSVISSALFFVDHRSTLEFYNPRTSEIDFDRAEYTPLNSKVWSIKPTAGLLVLFPSWLEHRANTVRSEDIRYSLSFDTQLTGTLEKDPFRK